MSLDVGYREKQRHKQEPVLIINSYAGSLHIAAQRRGHPVIGSYEDAGYGLPVQRLNYPRVDYKATRAEWPKQDLRGVIVLAHPPCAAFSAMTKRTKLIAGGYHGTNAAKFACTKQVMSYALSQGCDALAVESVVPALAGAWGIHKDYARRHGYHLYRLLQNAVTFGTPQWRPRFWAVFVRQSLANPTLLIHHAPRRSVVRDFLEVGREQTGSPPANLERNYERQREKLQADFGKAFAEDVLNGELGFGPLYRILFKREREQKPKTFRGDREVLAAHCVPKGFPVGTLVILDPDRYTPTLLDCSFWAVPGRPLTTREYQRLAGFPDDYVFPEHLMRQHNGLMSRGVSPPVAGWVLQTISQNLHARHAYYKRGSTTSVLPETTSVEPHGIANLCLTYKLWEELE